MTGLRRRLALALVACLALWPVRGGASGGATTVEALIAEAGLEGAGVGYVVAEGARTVATRRADEPFLPASTAKLATAVAALDVLGGEHRFATELRLDGDRLYLVGGGDPLLLVEELMSLASAAAASGLRRARLFYDDGLLVRTDSIDAEQSRRATYNPGVSALSLSFNRRRLIWRAGPDGGLEAFALPGSDLAPLNAALPGSPFGPIPTDALLGLGWAPPPTEGGKAWVPVRRPARFTANLFRKFAAMHGLALTEPQPAPAPPGARALARHDSRPLVDLVGLALQHSNNLLAELIGLGASRQLAGKPEPLAASAARLQAELDRRLGGDATAWRLDRHSGLSASARTSPARMAALLAHVRDRRYSGRSFQSLLPVSGWTGSLASWEDEPALVFRVWAKTGSMYYGRGLAGYLHAKSGRRLRFALFVSDLEARRRYDALGPEPDDEAQREAKDWLERARALERRLVAHWARTF